jgi:hypothetical protein
VARDRPGLHSLLGSVGRSGRLEIADLGEDLVVEFGGCFRNRRSNQICPGTASNCGRSGSERFECRSLGVHSLPRRSSARGHSRGLSVTRCRLGGRGPNPRYRAGPERSQTGRSPNRAVGPRRLAEVLGETSAILSGGAGNSDRPGQRESTLHGVAARPVPPCASG